MNDVRIENFKYDSKIELVKFILITLFQLVENFFNASETLKKYADVRSAEKKNRATFNEVHFRFNSKEEVMVILFGNKITKCIIAEVRAYFHKVGSNNTKLASMYYKSSTERYWKSLFELHVPWNMQQIIYYNFNI